MRYDKNVNKYSILMLGLDGGRLAAGWRLAKGWLKAGWRQANGWLAAGWRWLFKTSLSCDFRYTIYM